MNAKVGYLGPSMSTFGYMATEKFFLKTKEESAVEFVPYKTHEDVCLAVGKKEVNYGVVAIENGELNRQRLSVLKSSHHFIII